MKRCNTEFFKRILTVFIILLFIIAAVAPCVIAGGGGIELADDNFSDDDEIEPDIDPGTSGGKTHVSDWLKEGSVLEIDTKYVSGILTGQTKENILAEFNNAGCVRIVNDIYETLLPGDELYTGCKIQVVNDAGTATETLIIVVNGDVNGDGDIGTSDCMLIKAHLLGKRTLTGAYEKAAKVISGGDNVNILSYIRMKQLLFGL